MPFELEIDTRQSDTGKTIRVVKNFTNVEVEDKYNSVAKTFSFEFLFNPNEKEQAETVGVSHFHECKIYYRHENGTRELYTVGYIISQSFSQGSEEQLVNIGGYSKCGLIEDCDIPNEQINGVEFEGMTLSEIAKKILAPFNNKKGIKLIIGTNEANTSVSFSQTEKTNEEYADDYEINKTSSRTSENIKSFLTDICRKKNLVLSNTVNGDLLITTANTDTEPIFEIDLDKEKSFGITNMQLTYNGQEIFSHITAVRQADDEDGDSVEKTLTNELCPIVYRPRVFVYNDDDGLTIDEFLQARVSENLKSITLSFQISEVAINNKLIKPNSIVLIKSRKHYLYNKTRWFIESVKINESADNRVAVVNCVLPFVYNYFAKNADGAKKKYGVYNIFIDPHENLPSV